MKHVCDFLGELVSRGNYWLSWEELPNHSFSFDRDYTAWIESALQALGYAELQDYQAKVRDHHEHSPRPYSLAAILGLLQSAKECLERGFTGKVRHALRAEMFGSLITQARGLQRAGQLIPAAVLGRIALEDWIRDQAEAAGVPNHDTDKASKLNDALKASGRLTQPKWRRIQSHLDVGNAAAHGKEAEFTDEDVTQLLAFVEANCVG